MTYQNILNYSINEYLESIEDSPLTKTKILKLTYIVEYYYYKKYNKRLTNENWVFYHYGPYIFNYDDYIDRCAFSYEQSENGEYRIIKNERVTSDTIQLEEFEAKMLIKKIIKEYGQSSLDEILDFIYFDTEPMLKTTQRKQSLDFSSIQPEQKKQQNKLTSKDYSEILAKYKKKLENAIRI